MNGEGVELVCVDGKFLLELEGDGGGKGDREFKVEATPVVCGAYSGVNGGAGYHSVAV